MVEINAPISPEISSVSCPEIVAQLRNQISAINRCRNPRQEQGILLDIPGLADLFPQGQLPCGSIVEWFAEGYGTGVEVLSLQTGWAACRRGRSLVIVDPLREVYPPVLVQLGINLKRVVFIHPSTKTDTLWTIDQSLRCSAVGAVWSSLESVDPVNHRRWQLASECGGTLGGFVRPLKARKEPSWSEFRLLVQPMTLPIGETGSQRRRIQVTLFRAPGLWEPITREVWIDDPTDRLPDLRRVETPKLCLQFRKTGA